MYNLYMTLLRKIFFYLFALIYLVICPLIILRMLGFVKDPQTHYWVKTGIIYISSNPPGANVYLDGRRMPETTPTIIRDLTRGIYSIRMELDGYEAWENKVPVVDKKATSVENILLIPNKWHIQTLNNRPLSNIIPMPGNNYLLLTSGDTVKDILILRLDRDNETLESLFPEESIYRDARVVNYFTIEKSPFFVLAINVDNRAKYLWIDPREAQVHIEDISELLPQAPAKLYWEANDERNIYAYYGSGVNRIRIKEKAIYPNILEKDIPIEKKAVEKKKPLAVEPKADQLFLINNDNTILFRRGAFVSLMDEETFGKPRVTMVVKIKNNTDIYFAERLGKMFFIDEETGLLSTIQILHHRPFIPKPIANTLRLKLDK